MGSKNTYEENLERSNRLRGIRENLRMTQEAMAEILGISVDAYSKIENGVNGISNNVLNSYKKKFGISADYILFGTYSSKEDVWDLIMNCSEIDKMYLAMRLVQYFSQNQRALFTLKNTEESNEVMDNLLKLAKIF